METKPPGENSSASSPLPRVHRRQVLETKDVTSAASDDESASETNLKLHLSSHEDQERNVHNIDGTKQENVVPAGSQVVGLQEEFGSIPYHTLAQADSKEVDAIQHTDGDDMSLSECSKLRLQMKCLMQIQTKTTSGEEVDLSDLYSSNINTNPIPESQPVAVLCDYTDIGDSDRSLEDRNRPYGKGKSHFERKPKHRIHKRNVLESQNSRTSSDRSCSLSDASNTDSNLIVIPETPWYPHEVTVNVKAADVADLDEPLILGEASPYLRPVQPVAETAPPREAILSPICVPQIVLEQGPTVKYIAKPVSVVVKVDAQSQSCRKKTPTSSPSSESSSLQPPPSYSECIRHVAMPSGRAIMQQLPQVSRKTLQPPRKPEGLLPLCRTSPNLYAAPVAGYSQFHNTGPNLLDANISIYTGHKSDGQVSQQGGRTTFMDNEHQFLAFISCLFCWPIGLVAIYYSNMCQILKAEGNHAQAQVYGRQAFIVSTLAMCAGSLTYIIMLIYQRVW